MKTYKRKQGSTFQAEGCIAWPITAEITMRAAKGKTTYNKGDFVFLYKEHDKLLLAFMTKNEFSLHFDLEDKNDKSVAFTGNKLVRIVDASLDLYNHDPVAEDNGLPLRSGGSTQRPDRYVDTNREDETVVGGVADGSSGSAYETLEDDDVVPNTQNVPRKPQVLLRRPFSRSKTRGYKRSGIDNA